MSDEEMSYEDRLLAAFESNAKYLQSIAESLKILAAKPVPGITLEVSPELLDQQEEV